MRPYRGSLLFNTLDLYRWPQAFQQIEAFFLPVDILLSISLIRPIQLLLIEIVRVTRDSDLHGVFETVLYLRIIIKSSRRHIILEI
jgi:hypothetical protein